MLQAYTKAMPEALLLFKAGQKAQKKYDINLYFKYIGINQTFPFCFNYFGRQQNLVLNPQFVELG